MSVRGSLFSHDDNPDYKEALINFDSEKEEIDLLLQKIEAFGIHDRVNRVYLLHRLNDIQSSTRCLPNEILADIFYRIVDDKKPRYTRPQFIICAVSSHWRTVVWDTPNLWTKIKWNLLTTFIGGYGPLLKTYLDNSGSLPVSVEFSADKSRQMEEDDRNMFMDIMSMPQYVQKVQELHHFHVQLLPLLPQRLPALHRLSLDLIPFVPISDPIPAGLDLASVWYPLHAQLPWHGLTNLCLTDIYADICIELLKGCPDLVTFTSHRPSPPLFSGKPEREARVLVHLQHVKWVLGIWTAEDNIFLNLRFPAVRHVAFSAGIPLVYKGDFKHQFTKFLSDLPPTFKTLGLSPFISEPELCCDWLLDVFDWVPKITELILHDFWMFEFSEFFTAFYRSSFLPSLRILKYSFSGTSLVGNAETPSDLPDLSKRKKERGLGEFRMEVVNLVVGCDHGVREGLEDLVRGGFVLEIIEDGVMVDWLSIR